MILILNGEKKKIKEKFGNYILYSYVDYKVVFVDIFSDEVRQYDKLKEKISDLGYKYIVIGFKLDYFDPLNILWIYWNGYSCVDALSIVVHLRYLIDGYVFFLPGVLVDSVNGGKYIKCVVGQLVGKLDEYCESDGYGNDGGMCIFDKRFSGFYMEFLERYRVFYEEKVRRYLGKC